MELHQEGLVLLDTHAGIGTYELNRQTTNEYKEGIERVLDACSDESPALVQEYAKIVRSFNRDHGELRLCRYPGSPALVAALLRNEKDQHFLWELHPTVFHALESFLKTQSSCSTAYCQDGFVQVKSKLCDSRPNAVLIDPPFKHKDEYAKTLDTVKRILHIDSSATVMVWIPQLSCEEAGTLDRRLLQAVTEYGRDWVRASLTIQRDGLQGSTVVIVNPPTGLYEPLQSTLSWLATTLSQGCSDYSVTQSNG